jgi:hypothetical protein
LSQAAQQDSQSATRTRAEPLVPAQGGSIDFSSQLAELQHRAAEAEHATQAAASEHTVPAELRDGHWLRFLIMVGMVNNSWPGSPTRLPRQGRGHALTIDLGWRQVAQTGQGFGQRFTYD